MKGNKRVGFSYWDDTYDIDDTYKKPWTSNGYRDYDYYRGDPAYYAKRALIVAGGAGAAWAANKAYQWYQTPLYTEDDFPSQNPDDYEWTEIVPPYKNGDKPPPLEEVPSRYEPPTEKPRWEVSQNPPEWRVSDNPPNVTKPFNPLKPAKPYKTNRTPKTRKRIRTTSPTETELLKKIIDTLKPDPLVRPETWLPDDWSFSNFE